MGGVALESIIVRLLAAAALLLFLPRPSTSEEKPKLVLEAPRLHMLKPGLAARGYGKRVEFRATLEGEPEDIEAYYCLDEVWDWGDGTESVHEPDCEPFEETEESKRAPELKRRFSDSHAFGPGQWFITLALMNGDDVVIKGTLEIRVY